MGMEYKRLSRWELKELSAEYGVPLYEGVDIDQALSMCYWIGRMHERRNQETHGKEKSKDDK